MYDVAAKLASPEMIATLVGAAGAGISAVALALRPSGQRMKKFGIPKGFPNDGSANKEDYMRAYAQLVTRAAYADQSRTMDATTALEFASHYFHKSGVILPKQEVAGLASGKKS